MGSLQSMFEFDAGRVPCNATSEIVAFQRYNGWFIYLLIKSYSLGLFMPVTLFGSLLFDKEFVANSTIRHETPPNRYDQFQDMANLSINQVVSRSRCLPISPVLVTFKMAVLVMWIAKRGIIFPEAGVLFHPL